MDHKPNTSKIHHLIIKQNFLKDHKMCSYSDTKGSFYCKGLHIKENVQV